MKLNLYNDSQAQELAGADRYALAMPVLGVPTDGSGGQHVDLKTTFGG